ncbi:hypothetical protein AALP_AA1G344300 [Arabis alpina]|uniref:F-box associated beta-propeller type 1 domain-containing protein n=1 Tax=Arabis alpina TaxID=50452 RepID=A0A087HSK0_ARAAL|nr:hypothetical protein AALP_AA1G344300 [Arabis alpina]
MFMERRMSLQKSHRKILAAYNFDPRDRPRLLPEPRFFEGDEQMVFLHCTDAQRDSMMTCDGLVCFPEPNWVTVLNPSTRQLRRFRAGPDPESPTESEKCVMGFGRDKVTGSYRVVRMFFDPNFYCEILDVNIGEWLQLNPPPYMVHVGRRDGGRKSVCVNGSIYWLHIWWGVKILALNLHTLEFHDVSVSFPTRWVTFDSKIVNLHDRLAIVNTKTEHERSLEIWSMDAEEEIWTNTYSFSLAGATINPWEQTSFTLVTVSKFGDVLFFDNLKRLFKYYKETDEIRCLSSDICVISPYLENLAPLPSKLGCHSDLDIMTSRCGLLSGSGISKLLKGITFDIVLITLVRCLFKNLWNA